jgi:two-component system, LuxR family, sensor kinase FixL
VRNAIDAMGAVAPAQRRLHIASTRCGTFVEVAVQDSGPGISPELQEQVFNSFFTTKSQGMGMGLSISRSIIELHEGRIWVTPNAKCGVTFHFTLPAARRIRHDDAERDRIHSG